jgi:hypothetical protein
LATRTAVSFSSLLPSSACSSSTTASRTSFITRAAKDSTSTGGHHARVRAHRRPPRLCPRRLGPHPPMAATPASEPTGGRCARALAGRGHAHWWPLRPRHRRPGSGPHPPAASAPALSLAGAACVPNREFLCTRAGARRKKKSVFFIPPTSGPHTLDAHSACHVSVQSELGPV